MKGLIHGSVKVIDEVMASELLEFRIVCFSSVSSKVDRGSGRYEGGLDAETAAQGLGEHPALWGHIGEGLLQIPFSWRGNAS